MKLTALKNNIIFKFEDDINNSTKHNLFKEQTESGIYMPSNYDSTTKTPRWGIVVAAGPECTEVKEGMKILVEPLAWTNAVPLSSEEKVWKTDESRVLMVED